MLANSRSGLSQSLRASASVFGVYPSATEERGRRARGVRAYFAPDATGVCQGPGMVQHNMQVCGSKSASCEQESTVASWSAGVAAEGHPRPR